uniref:Methyltransferase type 11 domain-containing protein n=1 Tax=Acrobeloides nanus TaxID=290746 RepID=A0A914DKE5_9BILA
MVLLPKTQQEFADPKYWKQFFEKCETPFEWYGDYVQLAGVFDKYLKPADSILQIGCGNSILAEQLYDNGYRNVRSIDIDSKVIVKQQQRNGQKRPELVFECRSATEVGFLYNFFNAE